jgi:hypothetical protein
VRLCDQRFENCEARPAFGVFRVDPGGNPGQVRRHAPAGVRFRIEVGRNFRNARLGGLAFRRLLVQTRSHCGKARLQLFATGGSLYVEFMTSGSQDCVARAARQGADQRRSAPMRSASGVQARTKRDGRASKRGPVQSRRLRSNSRGDRVAIMFSIADLPRCSHTGDICMLTCFRRRHQLTFFSAGTASSARRRERSMSINTKPLVNSEKGGRPRHERQPRRGCSVAGGFTLIYAGNGCG